MSNSLFSDRPPRPTVSVCVRVYVNCWFKSFWILISHVYVYILGINVLENLFQIIKKAKLERAHVYITKIVAWCEKAQFVKRALLYHKFSLHCKGKILLDFKTYNFSNFYIQIWSFFFFFLFVQPINSWSTRAPLYMFTILKRFIDEFTAAAFIVKGIEWCSSGTRERRASAIGNSSTWVLMRSRLRVHGLRCVL